MSGDIWEDVPGSAIEVTASVPSTLIADVSSISGNLNTVSGDLTAVSSTVEGL